MLYGGENHDQGCPKGGANSSYGNVAPRVGFAYRLTRDGKTSLRGGIGYYYSPPQASIYNPYANIAPFAPTFTLNGVDFTDPFGSQGIVNPFPDQYGPKVRGPEATFTTPAALRAVFPKDFRIAQLLQWNIMVERQANDWLFRVGYHGNKGTHLYGLGAGPWREINPAIYVPGASTVGNTQQRRIYQDFANIGLGETGNNSNYQSLQVNIEKRFGRGLSVLTNYTWAKRLDDVGWTNPFNRRFDYGISADDVTHVFHLASSYQFPGLKRSGALAKIVNGWAVNSIVTWQSGFPFSVSSGLDNAFTGTGGQRADFLGGTPALSSSRPHAEMIARWFDRDPIHDECVGYVRQLGQGISGTRELFNTDFSAIKSTKLTERASLQFRAEFFNFFNNVNFGGPNSTVTSANFGRITSAGIPRILQGALKLIFDVPFGLGRSGSGFAAIYCAISAGWLAGVGPTATSAAGYHQIDGEERFVYVGGGHCCVGAGFRHQSTAESAEAVERGRAQFAQSCGFCHGPNANGGTHGPSLIRSAVVRHDENGNLIGAVIRDGRPDQGMPPIPLSPSQVSDIVAFLKSRVAAADIRSANRPVQGSGDKLLTGNAEAGKAFFDRRGRMLRLPFAYRRSCRDCPKVLRRWFAGAVSCTRSSGARTATVTDCGRQTVSPATCCADELRCGDSGCRRLVSFLAARARSSST